MRRIGVLVNPRAGSGGAAACGAAIAGRLRSHGEDVLELQATSADQARELAGTAIAGGLDVLVVAGGDGMVGLGAGLCALTDTALAIAAVGSGNDFARSMGLPVHAPHRAAAVIAAGHTRRIDLGRLDGPPGPAARPAPGHGGRWFAGVLAAGFDAIVNRRANSFAADLGRLGYSIAVARELPVLRPIPYRLQVDEQVLETEAMLVAVGNGTSYGGGLRMCAQARVDDGLFDVTIVHEVTRTELLKVFPRVFSGAHLRHPAVQVVRGARVRLEAGGAGAGLLAHADGEPLARLPLSCRTVPGALRLVVPGP